MEQQQPSVSVSFSELDGITKVAAIATAVTVMRVNTNRSQYATIGAMTGGGETKKMARASYKASCRDLRIAMHQDGCIVTYIEGTNQYGLFNAALNELIPASAADKAHLLNILDDWYPEYAQWSGVRGSDWVNVFNPVKLGAAVYSPNQPDGIIHAWVDGEHVQVENLHVKESRPSSSTATATTTQALIGNVLYKATKAFVNASVDKSMTSTLEDDTYSSEFEFKQSAVMHNLGTILSDTFTKLPFMLAFVSKAQGIGKSTFLNLIGHSHGKAISRDIQKLSKSNADERVNDNGLVKIDEFGVRGKAAVEFFKNLVTEPSRRVRQLYGAPRELMASFNLIATAQTAKNFVTNDLINRRVYFMSCDVDTNSYDGDSSVKFYVTSEELEALTSLVDGNGIAIFKGNDIESSTRGMVECNGRYELTLLSLYDLINNVEDNADIFMARASFARLMSKHQHNGNRFNKPAETSPTVLDIQKRDLSSNYHNANLIITAIESLYVNEILDRDADVIPLDLVIANLGLKGLHNDDRKYFNEACQINGVDFVLQVINGENYLVLGLDTDTLKSSWVANAKLEIADFKLTALNGVKAAMKLSSAVSPKAMKAKSFNEAFMKVIADKVIANDVVFDYSDLEAIAKDLGGKLFGGAVATRLFADAGIKKSSQWRRGSKVKVKSKSTQVEVEHTEEFDD